MSGAVRLRGRASRHSLEVVTVAHSIDRREPFSGIVELHERMGHPIRVGALGRQAFCVHCNLLWSAHEGWYSTDVVDPLADLPRSEDEAAA